MVLLIMAWLSPIVDEIVASDHSNESYRAVLSYGGVDYAVQGGSYF